MSAALQTPDEVRAVALALSHAADAYNKRLKAEAARLSSGEVFARLQEEQRLRGIANQLWFEASQRTLVAAVDDQASLESTLAEVEAGFGSMARFDAVLELIADLLVLGGAIVSGKVSPILAALDEVRRDVAQGRGRA